MSITPLPPLDRTSGSFKTDVDTYFGSLIPQFGVEANELAAAMTAIAAGTAFAIPYTFSTTTTDSDPGAGMLRLNNATQNAATTMRFDLTGADGKNWTSVLDTFDDSTNDVKGQIRLVKVGDGAKWLAFNVTALSVPSGYRNLAVTNVGSSDTNPFVNGDSILLLFTRTGDKGDTGPVASVGNHEVVVHTGNGHGSTNTMIRRFTTAMVNVGTAITYADSAANGASFTINDTGLYAIHYSDEGPVDNLIGVSVNSSELTTGVAGITVASRPMLSTNVGNAGSTGRAVVSRTVMLSAGDVVRAHTGGSGGTTGTTNRNIFAIRKVGFV